MHPDLERLIRLQRAESELKKLESELAEVPRRRESSDSALAEERGRLETAKEALTHTQKARRSLEGELQDLEAKRSKYKGQLMDVKTNKEYTAMLHEIETVEREIRSREDLVLAEMERAEALTAEIKREELLFQGAQERHAAETRELKAQVIRLTGEEDRMRAERDAVAATVSEEGLQLFHRIAKLRGHAVSEGRDGMCSSCHLKLRLQMYVELKHNADIRQCPGCNRILFYEPPVPVTVPEP